MKNYSVKPYWFADIHEIKLPQKLQYLKPDPLREVILNKINLTNLISSLGDGNKLLIQNPKLFKNNFSNKKTQLLIYQWKLEKQILPPSIKYCIKTNKIFISDGRHRINLALFLEATHIPICVSLTESRLIEFLLKE